MKSSVKMKHKPHISEQIRRHWFLIGILVTIILSSIHPSFGTKEGPLNPEFTVKYVAVSLIFFISGLSLKADSMAQTFRHYKLHLFIQIFTFLLIPIFLQVIVRFLAFLNINGWILKGLITVSCMPPPVSSAVILTRAAQGNEAAAIFNSVLGSFLGIIVTPISLLLNLGITTLVPLMGTLVQLSITVIAPLILGQAIRSYTSFRGHNLPLNTIGQCALLFVIYTTFCDSFNTNEIGLSAPDILITVFLVVVLQVFLLAMSFSLAINYKKWFTTADIVAIVFCSTHKSLTLGIPILKVMFHGFSHLSQISLPLLVYHPTQIIMGGLLVASLKHWSREQKYKQLPF